ncbi:MAG: hypothetical protein ACREYE_25655 [Gammaproteobacteria bacterium]
MKERVLFVHAECFRDGRTCCGEGNKDLRQQLVTKNAKIVVEGDGHGQAQSLH